METMEVILQDALPTPWCARMAMYSSKEVWFGEDIYGDLKLLNQNIFRKVHPHPKTDETLAQLAEYSSLMARGYEPGREDHEFDLIPD